MKKTIAIVEDDTDQRLHYADALRKAGYTVVEYAGKDEAISRMTGNMPDMAILDIILGNEVGGGFDVCRFLKSGNPRFPVIFLTSRGNELDQIYGLQLGAWDYQTKPVSLPFLITRVDSLFQIFDHRPDPSAAGLERGGLFLDKHSMTARWRDEPVELTPTEFDLLYRLLQTPDGVSTDELMGVTRQGMVEENTINTHILHIRKKIRRIDPDFSCIKARYGFGYCWVC